MHARATLRHTLLMPVLLAAGPIAAADPDRAAANSGWEATCLDLVEQRGLPRNRVAYRFRSQFLRDVPIRVIVTTPTTPEPGRRYPVLYLLNEYAGNCTASNEALGLTALADAHGVICVDAGYPSHPWYADHPTDPRRREESFLLETVIPLVDAKHPTIAAAAGRYLLGYSKGGFGAFTLLLRHPDTFARAAAWDAPLSLEAPDRWNMPEAYGTAGHFAGYCPTRLLRDKAALLRAQPPRLVVLGHGLFGPETERTHRLLEQLGIPHDYDNATERRHEWGSGWLPDAVARLVR